MKSSSKLEMCQRLKFKEAGDQSLYLGLPINVGRKKTAIFGYLKEKFQERIEGWDKKDILKDGKNVLLKTVVQALPNYAMSIFLLPVDICKDLEKRECVSTGGVLAKIKKDLFIG